jgi:hypothetical protein
VGKMSGAHFVLDVSDSRTMTKFQEQVKKVVSGLVTKLPDPFLLAIILLAVYKFYVQTACAR